MCFVRPEAHPTWTRCLASTREGEGDCRSGRRLSASPFEIAAWNVSAVSGPHRSLTVRVLPKTGPCGGQPEDRPGGRLRGRPAGAVFIRLSCPGFADAGSQSARSQEWDPPGRGEPPRPIAGSPLLCRPAHQQGLLPALTSACHTFLMAVVAAFGRGTKSRALASLMPLLLLNAQLKKLSMACPVA